MRTLAVSRCSHCCAPPRWVRFVGLVALLWGGPSIAFANEFDDFQDARGAYEAADYAQSRQRFESLVGGEIPRLANRSLILESHKYLAATYLFLDQGDLAEVQFERLLALEQDYVLDPLAFPHDVQVAFERVRTRLAEARAERAQQEARAAERTRGAKDARRRDQQARIQQLRTLAATESVEARRSRLVAMMPFGIGQFQNGDDGLGWGLAVASGTLLATNVITFFLHKGVAQEPVTESNRTGLQSSEAVLRYTNQISLGLLLVVAVTGIVDAQFRFQPSSRSERRRHLPKQLEEPFEFGFRGDGVELRF